MKEKEDSARQNNLTCKGMLIDGVEVFSTDVLPVVNPATGKEFACVTCATDKNLDAAVESGKRAFFKWKTESVSMRRKCLSALAELMESEKILLAQILSREQGKPEHTASMEEVNYAIDWLQKIADMPFPEKKVLDVPEQQVEQYYEPLGVVGLIVPWNFPVVLAVWKFAPALLTGNTIVLKPSSHTPLATLKIGELAQKVFPAGVFNVLIGTGELGQWMSEHSGISKISFTGSVLSGKKVMASAAQTLKRITLELGGNDPAIVLPDVDLHEAVPKLFWGAFGNSGQWCVGIKRLFVHDQVYDAVVEQLIAYAGKIVMGNGADPDSQLGPVQNAEQYAKLTDMLDDIKGNDYHVLFEGETPEQDGYFIPVTMVDNPPDESRIVREEAFGPILPIQRYHDFNDVIRRANDTEYGLGASIWGRDVTLINRLSEQLNAGTVWINEVYVHDPKVPFGGHKLSGLGVEHGEEGLSAYMNIRVRMMTR